MNNSLRDSRLKVARLLAILVIPLAAWAALTGILPNNTDVQSHIMFKNLWSSEVTLDGKGLYRLESVSGAAQERAQDLVTLAIALPALIAAIFWSNRKSQRSRVFLTGILGYFLYGYGLLAFGAVYNSMFLVYVAIFSLSLYGFILAILSIDAEKLETLCTSKYPRALSIGIDIAVGTLLSFMWLARILPGIASGTPPSAIDGYHTLFVQASDLGVLVPVAFMSAWLLIKRRTEGYLIGTILLVKGATMGLAVAVMGVSMNLSGSETDAPIPLVVAFFLLAFACLTGTFLALRSMKDKKEV